MKRLDQLSPGGTGVISRLSGGGKFLSRVTSIGFVPDTDIAVVRNEKHGPLIVKLKDTEVAIGRGEAAKIEVEEAVK